MPHLQLPASLEAVSRITAELQAALPERLQGADRHGVEIGLAEALTNIVVHGYAGRPDGAITIDWQEDDAGVALVICDGGQPIPPEALARARKHVFDADTADVANLPEGGMGLPLIHATFDVVDYNASAGNNCLRLVKRFR